MTTTIDFDAIKTRQQKMWSSGDYAKIGVTLQGVGENLCDALDVSAGWRVLDVAAGNGNVSLAAARRGCNVTATDYVPELLDLASARATAEHLPLAVQVADAEELPFDDDSFDAAVSTFGVMFAPDQDSAATEMARVCRPGAKIGLANWTPDGFVGAMLRTVGRHVPPPAGVRSPSEWGTVPRLQELFEDQAILTDTTERTFVFRATSIDAWVETFAGFYGPIVTALANLDADGRASLRAALHALATEHNRSTDATVRIPATYLEVIATVR